MTENSNMPSTATDKNLPLVSLITIIYNGEKYIEECIKSIITQDYKRIQYIIIDGGSTDNSLNIINKYAAHVDILVSEKDRGISDAFNKGLAKATGDIVGILNSDDLYSPSAIKSVVDSYVSNQNRSGVYYGDVLYFDDNSKLELVADAKNLWKYMSIFHPATFVTKDTYDQFGGYSEDYRYAMDCELIHRFLYHKVEFIHIKKTLAHFRLEGTSDKNFRKSQKEFYQSVKKYNNTIFAGFYYRWSVIKKVILHTKLGQYLKANRGLISWLLAGKTKK